MPSRAAACAREGRIDAGQLPDALPDLAERRQRRRLVVVEQTVRLAAQRRAAGRRGGAPRASRSSSSSSPGDELRLAQLGEMERRRARGGWRARRRRGRRVRGALRAAVTASHASPHRGVSCRGRPSASSSGRWVAGSSRAWCSCWPCSSTSSPTSVAERRRRWRAAPSTKARLRPWAVTSRRTIDARGRRRSRRWPRRSAGSSPVRTRSAEARPPSSRPTAPTSMDLPAPVSPVSTLNACSKSTDADSMTARFLIARYRIIEWSPEGAGLSGWRRKCHRIMGLTEFHRTCYGCTLALFPAAHLLPAVGGVVAHVWIRCSWPYRSGRRGARPRALSIFELIIDASLVSKAALASCCSSRSSRGASSSQRRSRCARAERQIAVVPRRLPHAAPSSRRCRASASRWSTARSSACSRPATPS